MVIRPAGPAPAEAQLTAYVAGVVNAVMPDVPPDSSTIVTPAGGPMTTVSGTLVSLRKRTVDPGATLAAAGWNPQPRIPSVTATTIWVGSGRTAVVVVAPVVTVVGGGTPVVRGGGPSWLSGGRAGDRSSRGGRGHDRRYCCERGRRWLGRRCGRSHDRGVRDARRHRRVHDDGCRRDLGRGCDGLQVARPGAR